MPNNDAVKTCETALQNWGLWTCGHAVELGKESEHTSLGPHGPTTHCGTCKAQVLPWPLPVCDAFWTIDEGMPTTSQPTAPGLEISLTPRPVPLIPNKVTRRTRDESSHILAGARPYQNGHAAATAAYEECLASRNFTAAADYVRIAITLNPMKKPDLVDLERILVDYMDPPNPRLCLLEVEAYGPFYPYGLNGGAVLACVDYAHFLIERNYQGAPSTSQVQNNARSTTTASFNLLTATSFSLQKLDELPNCAVTLEPVYDPVTLSCGHTFEHASIRKLCEGAHECRPCRCPLCRREVYAWPTVNLPLRAAIETYSTEHSPVSLTAMPARFPPLAMPIDAVAQQRIVAYMQPAGELGDDFEQLPPAQQLTRVRVALQDKPYVLDWLVLRARLEEQLTGLKEALPSWRNVLLREPRHVEASYKLAKQAVNKQMYAVAVSQLKSVAKRPDFDAKATLLLVYALKQQNYRSSDGDIEHYATTALTSFELDPFSCGQFYSERAYARLALGKTQDAFSDLVAFQKLKIGSNATIKGVEAQLAKLWGGQVFLQSRIFFLMMQTTLKSGALELWHWVCWLVYFCLVQTKRLQAKPNTP